MNDIISLGLWIKRRRKALDLTQRDLAQQVGCSLEMIRKIEADARRPSRQTAERLAEQLALPPVERSAFIQVARAELSTAQLGLPAQSIARGAFTPISGTAAALIAPMQSAEVPTALPRGTITFLFTNIADSTRLLEQYPDAIHKAIARHNAILTEVISTHQGVIITRAGDGVLAVFPLAPDALMAALKLQRAFQVEDWGMVGPLRVRMALHTAVVEERDEDYIGPSLNRITHLLAAGQDGQILLSRAFAELLHDHLPAEVELRDLGTHRLKGLTRPEQFFELVAPDLPADVPPLKTLDERRTNLPNQPTALIGRAQEVASVCALLLRAETRLVTLTGTGGTGKTRLAIQAAVELLDAFVDGVWFVDLAPISDPALVLPTIVQTIGLAEQGLQTPLAQLQAYLQKRQILLVLDNFEQVVDAAVSIAQLLAAASRLRILVTSRVVLHLRGEQEYAVLPLALPDPKQLPPLEELSQYAAVELFFQRARDVKLDFQVTNANAQAVAEICTRLDGLPLAIELAAARVKLFTPEALLKRLEQRLRVLVGGPRDLPTRQQTIRNTIDWSYQLLDEGEQRLFRQLGVFVGGCTLEAAEAVCNADGDLPFDVAEGVVALADKSLLRLEKGLAGEPRFVMLETIREYALERLAATGEVNVISARHAAAFLKLAETAAPWLNGAEQVAWLDRLEAELDNLRAALNWYQQMSDAESELRLVSALGMFWTIRGYLSEGRMWLAGALACSQAVVSSTRATALNRAAWLQDDNATSRALYQESLVVSRMTSDKRNIAFALRGLGNTTNDAARAEQLRAESLALYRELGDAWGMCWVLNEQAVAAAKRRTVAQAAALFAESLALARSLGDPWLTSTTLLSAAEVIHLQGDNARAHVLLTESLELARVAQNRYIIAASLFMLGHVARAQRDDVRASARYDESLALAQSIGARLLIARVRHNQAYIALHQGDTTQATSFLMESLTISREIGSEGQMAWGLMVLGGVAVATGQPERGTKLLGAAEAYFTAINQWVGETERAEHDSYIAAARAQLGEAAFAVVWAKGQAMSPEQAIAYASER